MRMLLTGATGFIGKHVVARLADTHEIFALLRGARTELAGRGVVPIHADLLAPIDPNRLPQSIDVVAHLAQHNGIFPLAGRELFAINTARTQELLDYGIRHGARQFVLASSGDVYGYRQDPCTEADPVAPCSFYAVTKYCSEMLVRQYDEHLDTTIFRLFTPYGPGQTGRLVPAVATRVLEGKPLKLHAGHRPLLTPTYIDDVVAAFERAVTTPTTGIFNIAGDTVISVRGIADAVGRVVGKEPVFEETGEDVGNVIGNNTRMKQVLGILPAVGLNEGLERTISILRR
jgi:UDP-glucose 4-epimerase